jgi:hypothetical protein
MPYSMNLPYGKNRIDPIFVYRARYTASCCYGGLCK